MTGRVLLLTSIAAICCAGTTRSQESTPPDTNRPHARGEFFHALPPDQQERFFKLLKDWTKLPHDQRRGLVDKFSQSHDLNAEQRKKLEQSLERFEQMPPEQCDRIRERMHKWKEMTPEEKESLHTREQEMREKAEQDMKRTLDNLGIQPATEQMRWIRQFYFHKRSEIEHQIMQRARKLKSQLPSDASDEDKQTIRQQLQEYRKDLEEKAKPEFEEFARNPHALAPPPYFGGVKPHRKPPPRPQAESPVSPVGETP
ncbi:MAG: DUF3106 domain-containing protein [Verrucomicrobiae bacterium]|nr:DUF3106 domain-containing protein [Verrucomicrobiae bacterium]